MKNSQKHELNGRKLFLEYCEQIPDIHYTYFTPNEFDSTDTTYWSGFQITVAEIKTRTYESTKFDTWMIEKHKVDEMRAINKTAHTYSTYINIWPDAMAIWDLTHMTDEDFKWQDFRTWTDGTKKEERIKKVAFLPLSGASHIYKLKTK